MTILLHLLLVLVVAPLLPGVISRTKAIVAGRTGPPLLQGYYDIAKLLQRGTVLSGSTTPIFLIGPAVALGGAVLASLMLPLGASSAPVAFVGDVIVFVYIFALARFFTTSAALDTGSAFEGMGAAREVTFAVLTEPAILLGMLALARLTHSLSLSGMLRIGWGVRQTSSAALVLVIASWLIVLLAENSRVPFDDPNTHLELTMIHEVMVLDHSGPDLGLILYGAAMKLLLSATLIGDLLRPATGSPLLDTLAFLVILLLLAGAVGLVESAMARLRMIRVPQLLIGTTLLSFFALILLLR